VSCCVGSGCRWIFHVADATKRDRTTPTGHAALCQGKVAGGEGVAIASHWQPQHGTPLCAGVQPAPLAVPACERRGATGAALGAAQEGEGAEAIIGGLLDR
jgi:hypothetical protein